MKSNFVYAVYTIGVLLLFALSMRLLWLMYKKFSPMVEDKDDKDNGLSEKD